jgi:hypothetical protein
MRSIKWLTVAGTLLAVMGLIMSLSGNASGLPLALAALTLIVLDK